MNLWPHTITVIRPGVDATDDWGNPVEGWATATETPVAGCSVQPDLGLEFIEGQQMVEDLWRVLVRDATVDIAPTDRVRYAGAVYDVNGEVQRWDFPPLSHVEFKMRRIDAH